jgi:hypothetical protein
MSSDDLNVIGAGLEATGALLALAQVLLFGPTLTSALNSRGLRLAADTQRFGQWLANHNVVSLLLQGLVIFAMVLIFLVVVRPLNASTVIMAAQLAITGILIFAPRILPRALEFASSHLQTVFSLAATVFSIGAVLQFVALI